MVKGEEESAVQLGEPDDVPFIPLSPPFTAVVHICTLKSPITAFIRFHLPPK